MAEKPETDQSLRTLGGTGEQFTAPRALAPAINGILNGTAIHAAQVALNPTHDDHVGLEWMMRENRLTPKQADLIRAAMLPIVEGGNRGQPNDVLSRLVNLRGDNTALAIRKLFGWEKPTPEGGIDMYV